VYSNSVPNVAYFLPFCVMIINIIFTVSADVYGSLFDDVEAGKLFCAPHSMIVHCSTWISCAICRYLMPH